MRWFASLSFVWIAFDTAEMRRMNRALATDYSCLDRLIYWLIDSLIHWFIDSLLHWLIDSVTHSLFHCFIDSLIHWIILSSIHALIHRLFIPLFYWLVQCRYLFDYLLDKGKERERARKAKRHPRATASNSISREEKMKLIFSKQNLVSITWHKKHQLLCAIYIYLDSQKHSHRIWIFGIRCMERGIDLLNKRLHEWRGYDTAPQMIPDRKWSPDRTWSPNWTTNDPEPEMIPDVDRKWSHRKTRIGMEFVLRVVDSISNYT